MLNRISKGFYCDLFLMKAYQKILFELVYLQMQN